MKIASVYLENFKRFERLEIKAHNALTGEISDRLLLLGDNGTGKTSVLQAIALPLGLASRRVPSVEHFNWAGWLPGRYQRWGRPVIELEVHFTKDELAITRELARRWYDTRGAWAQHNAFIEPGDQEVVRLRLEGTLLDAGSRSALYQFQGRYYAVGLLQTDPSVRDLFRRLPGVFWFDQFRNLASVPAAQGDDAGASGGRISFQEGLGQIREQLNRWMYARLAGASRSPRIDFLAEIETVFRKLFPGRSFSGPEPMATLDEPAPRDYYFTLNDGQRTYDIEEASAGEHSILPLLVTFVRQQIGNSIVLVDEIDLNLHPPLAQALVSVLPLLGPGCQYFLTTHADAVCSVVSPHDTRRLAGGRLCL